MKSLLYKDYLLIKKYYVWLAVGLVIMNFALPKNMMIMFSALVLLFFQGICVKTVIWVDKESNFREFVLASMGERKYVDNIYVLSAFHIILSVFLSFIFMYDAGVSMDLIKLFLSVQLFVCSLIWAIQIPLSYKKDVSTFRVVEFMLLIFLISMIFGLGGQYYAHFISTIIKIKPNLWNDELNVKFDHIFMAISILCSICILSISRCFLLGKKCMRKC